MKKFRILGIVALLIFIVNFVFSFGEGWEEASDSFEEGWSSFHEKEYFDHSYRTISVNVKPSETTRLSSLPNAVIKADVPYKIEKIRIPVVMSVWGIILMFFGAFSAFAVLFGFYCLIRLLISISRRSVFTRDNVVRIRVFTYTLVAFSILATLIEWFSYMEVTRQITLPGYEIKDFDMPADWLLLVIVVLFTEIFAVGVKIKEEQDLTI